MTMVEQSSSVRDHYEQRGYVAVRDVVDADLVAEARDHIDWLRERHPDLRPEQLHDELMTDDPFWVRLVSDDRLLDVAEQFVGSNIALFASHYIAKPPRDGQAVLWHQDGCGWPLDPLEVVTLWLALDDSTPENGCLRVVPGTHTLGLQEIRRRNDVRSVLGWEIGGDAFNENEAVDVVLAPGDVSIHHPNLVHGSNANTSPRWRRGLTIRYIPTTTRITKGNPFPSAFLLRGDAVPGVNMYNLLPRYIADKHMPFRDQDAWNQGVAARQGA